MTIAAIFSLLALIIFVGNIALCLLNLSRRETVIPMEAIWAVWVIGMALLIISWVV